MQETTKSNPKTSSTDDIRRSTSRSSLRSRAMTTSSAMSSVSSIDKKFYRQIYSVDIDQLKNRAAGIKTTSPPLRLVSKTQTIQGSVNFDDLLAMSRSDTRSLPRSVSSEDTGCTSALPPNDLWFENDLPERACSAKELNLTQFFTPKSPKPKLRPFTHSIDNMHLTNYLPRSPRLCHRQPQYLSPSILKSPQADRKSLAKFVKPSKTRSEL